MATAVLEINAWQKFGFFDACACLVKVRVTKPAQASKKPKKNKPLDAQNLHRHQKKQKKTLSIYSGLGVYRSQKFCFFCFFWCLCRFCEDHALVFLVFLMPVHVWWRLESQNLHRHQKNKKKQTTRCTKPAQASKKTKKKNKTLSIYSGLGVYRSQKFWFFCFFWFFDACAGFVKIMLWFFWFFWCLCRFCEDHAFFCLFFSMPAHGLSKSAKMKKWKSMRFTSISDQPGA